MSRLIGHSTALTDNSSEGSLVSPAVWILFRSTAGHYSLQVTYINACRVLNIRSSVSTKFLAFFIIKKSKPAIIDPSRLKSINQTIPAKEKKILISKKLSSMMSFTGARSRTLLFLLLIVMYPPPSSSTTYHSLQPGSSLIVENPKDALVSPNGVFAAGFYAVGDNVYCFAIWFTSSSSPTAVWMANRDDPVNGRDSELLLLRSGNLVLRDAGRFDVWSTSTFSSSPSVQLRLLDTGNLVLSTESSVLWQSFDFPTDTLLPRQPFTRNAKLISSRSRGNHSSGFYNLYFDNDNMLRLLFNGPEVSSIYWPNNALHSWEVGRTEFNSSRVAIFDDLGYFLSSDALEFWAADFGKGPKRRLTLDFDGNLRLYSLDGASGSWDVSWQAFSKLCEIHGLCGPNGVCSYEPLDLKCSCLPGFKIKNHTDWSYGCEPEFNLSCDDRDSAFLPLPNVEMYGYDRDFTLNLTFEGCAKKCLQLCDCKGFLVRPDKGKADRGVYNCYPKVHLLNGFRSPDFPGTLHLKLPKEGFVSYGESMKEFRLNCSASSHLQLHKEYARHKEPRFFKYLWSFVLVIGGVEMISIFLVWLYLRKSDQENALENRYLLAGTGFRKFSYRELTKATWGFSVEIGRGGGGVVYKGLLSDGRTAAIKRLHGASQGEEEFLAEVRTIGRINHMNLIEMWGFCAEGKHRLLVYEYMEHGSLAENLSSKDLDWEKRYDIAIGTAKGLAYLHEECLEWVLHCDVKPQNILLDSNYKPKVADFGLSKLLDRGNLQKNSRFSKIRGTRGYMAPEWVFNLPITSKVDVYSYGIVVLEMLTGKGRMELAVPEINGGCEKRLLILWLREMMNETIELESKIKQILNPMIDSEYDVAKIATLLEVALKCVEEEKDARPTMSQVVEMLQGHENGY